MAFFSSLLFGRRVLLILLAGMLLCGSASFSAAGWADPDADLATLDRLEIFQPGEPSILYSIREEPFASLTQEFRIFVPLDRIPKMVQQAVLDAEDADFYRHGGISLKGIARAAIRNLASAKVKEGGSTITQQLAKTLLLSPERTFSRKVKEVQIAREIERRFSKDKILEMYLNCIYFGSGAYGIEAAARTYFSRSIGQLSVAEAALLAGLIKSPGTYSPLTNPKKAQERRDYILSRMEAEGHLKPAQTKAAKRQAVAVRPLFKARGAAPHFVDFLRKELEGRYGRAVTARGGLRVYTTLDLEMQRQAVDALRTGLRSIEQSVSGRRKTGAPPAPSLECGLVALDPATGEIRAMVGGLDYGKSQFNRVVQAHRQPGSAFKPFVYAAALARGYAPTRLIDDYPVSYSIPQNGRLVEWSPENYDRQFRGRVTLRRALEESINVPTVRLLEEIGVSNVIGLASRAGIHSTLRREYALALGVSEVTLLELAGAYTAFANRGIAVKPVGIRRIEGPGGNQPGSQLSAGERVLSEETAYILSSVLSGVVERGTGRRARVPGWNVSAKTGTSHDGTDLWLVGYTPRLLAGLWIGADQPRPLGSHETAGRLAAPVWADFMRRALKGTAPVAQPIPEGILPIRVDYRTGELASHEDANSIAEYVVRGETLPRPEDPGSSAPLPSEQIPPAAPPVVSPAVLPDGAGER